MLNPNWQNDMSYYIRVRRHRELDADETTKKERAQLARKFYSFPIPVMDEIRNTIKTFVTTHLTPVETHASVCTFLASLANLCLLMIDKKM
jgi:hypothetical protein